MTNAKAQLVRSWLIKAQHDLASARVLAASEPPLLDTAIYHCQQAAEKAVKGYLVFCDQEFERTHDIELLVQTAARYAQGFLNWIDVGIKLTPYARIYRYPGYAGEPDSEQVAWALSAAEGLYRFVVSLLPPEIGTE
ncbi:MULTISPECIES: HEPN domain-containing protein [Chloracidobacterium]|jgi:HEPN domain-containing protein|uniref:HEPN domain-containing protein n=1 Tax=Chloracidobacterium TaxID=458032 RepID=UPI0005A0723A|nr:MULTISPECIES: HEPN domain-containing protein [Chloracidobacterium]QUV79696.1 HEPN domain-containing protein [Chloracidobacterium thermophilum]QUV82734.1 HEPN domain-containing protein [Chloracidobacterium sp. D]